MKHLFDELNAVRAKLRTNADEMSRSAETSTQYVQASQRLVRYDSLIQQLKDLLNEQSHEMVRDTEIKTRPRQPGVGRVEAQDTESDKARGERVRTNWVSAHCGTALSKLKGALYRNSRGEILGIAYAQEKAYRTSRWFAGLPSGKFDCVAVLCEPIGADVFAVCLPTSFVQLHLPQLSRSRIGQVKFNVLRRGNDFFLDIPNVGQVDVTKHRDDFAAIL